MDYKATMEWLYTLLPNFQRQGGAAYKPGLERINKLLSKLDNPQNRIPAIHIAGTNGKGTLAHSLAAVCQHNGQKTGLYTSPHLFRFTERIKVNGDEIAESAVLNFIALIKEDIEQLNPSFFEVTVAMAFYHFAQEQCNIMIIETGMGGRLDSTNVVSPVLSIITSIGYDHQQWLGDTLLKIAGEKAGIIKDKVPVVIGIDSDEYNQAFITKAGKTDSEIIWSSKQWRVKQSDIISSKVITYHCENIQSGNSISIMSDLNGPYQYTNFPCILSSIEWLSNFYGFDFTKSIEALKAVKESTGLVGRWDILGDKPLIIADGGHNEMAIKSNMKAIRGLDVDGVHIVIGGVKDKEWDKIIIELPKDALYYLVPLENPRGIPVDELAELFASYNLAFKVYNSVNQGVAIAESNLHDSDLLYIGGSNFLITELEQYINAKKEVNPI